MALGPICQQLVFAAWPEYLSLTYHNMSSCPKYKGTTCLRIPTTLVCTYLPHRVGSGLSEEFSVKVGVHQGSVLSPLLFAKVIDEVRENVRKGWMKQILYVDDLILMGETMEELRENFDEWRQAFESKRMRVNLGKTKLMVSGMEEETFDSKIDSCGVCGTRVIYSMWKVGSRKMHG